MTAAERLGFPVVVKVDSADIVHKTDVGGVRVGCADAAAVREATGQILAEAPRRSPGARIDGVLVQRMVRDGIEMILGVKHDALFGPAVVCDSAGSSSICCATCRYAWQMLAALRGAAPLQGARGRPLADVAGLDCPIIIAEYGGVQRVLDGNHRINRWVEAGDTRVHDVNIHAVSQPWVFIELPAVSRGA